jgi:mRNA interferase MazF
MNPQPGEIWLADLGLAAKTRPVVIVSRQDPNPHHFGPLAAEVRARRHNRKTSEVHVQPVQAMFAPLVLSCRGMMTPG